MICSAHLITKLHQSRWGGQVEKAEINEAESNEDETTWGKQVQTQMPWGEWSLDRKEIGGAWAGQHI